MPRFARGTESWAVILNGASFTVTAAGKTSTRKFLSPEQARIQYDKVIQTQLAAGFEEEAAALEPSPFDRSAYLVHADLLQTKGDPRGELIAVQVALEDAADAAQKATLATRASDLLAEGHDVLLRELAPHARSSGYPPASSDRSPKALEIVWRRGAIWRASLVARPKIDLAALYAGLRSLPAAYHLAELLIGAPVLRSDLRHGAPPSYDALFAAIARHGVFPHLESLVLDDAPSSAKTRPASSESRTSMNYVELENMEAVLGALPHLRSLVLRAAIIGDVGALTFPKLSALELTARGIGQRCLAAIAVAKLPRLERLTLCAESSFLLEEAPARVVLGADLPALRHLAMHGHFTRNVPLPPDVMRSAVLRRLKTLDLSDGAMDDDGAEVLMAHRSSLAHLESLDLRRNFISAATTRELRAALPNADVGGQRDGTANLDDENDADSERYDSVRE